MEGIYGDIGLSLDQRYYCIIVMRSFYEYQIADMWSVLNDSYNMDDESEKKGGGDLGDVLVERRRIISEKAYARGAVLQQLSVGGDLNPPYKYDVCLMRIFVDGCYYYIFAFPFTGLAKDIIGVLVDKYELTRKLDFVKVDLNRLMDLNEVRTKYEDVAVKAHLIAVKLSVHNETSLSAMMLRGDNPLKSSFYKDVLEGLIKENYYKPQQCALSCELGFVQDLNTLKSDAHNKKIRSHVHVDVFGNYRTYIHLSGANVLVFPFLIKSLVLENCLLKGSDNPLNRMLDMDTTITE
jgi:hypothetical protein